MSGQGLDGPEAQVGQIPAEGVEEYFLDVEEFIETPEVQQLAQEGEALLQAQLEQVAPFEDLEQFGFQAEFLPLQMAQDGFGLGRILAPDAQVGGQGAEQAITVGEGAEDVTDRASQLGPGSPLGQELSWWLRPEFRPPVPSRRGPIPRDVPEGCPGLPRGSTGPWA